MQPTSSRETPQVLLIHLDSFYNLDYSHFNQGLLYIATCLRRAGFGVKCLDTSVLFFLPPRDLAAYVRNLGIRMAGFYTLSDNLPLVVNLARILKQECPELVVVAGGPLATVMGAELAGVPEIDVVAQGEGELIMEALARHYLQGEGNLEDIPGISYRQDGVIHHHPPAAPLADLDSLPVPDYGLTGKPPLTIQVVTGRGCPYGCIFCFQEVHGRRYRKRSVASVAAEVESQLRRYPQVNSLQILDDTFVADPQRVEEICKALVDIRRRLGRRFIMFCEGRVNVLARHPELLDLLREAGLVRLQIGIESGDPDMLRRYQKGITLEEVRTVVEACAGRGIPSVVGNFILGGPGETEETVQRSLRFALDLLEAAPGVFECTTAFLCPYPGTQVGRDPTGLGLRVVDDEFSRGLTLSDVHLETAALDRNRLRVLQGEFQTRVRGAMRRLAPKVPRPRIREHFRLKTDYGLHSFWYLEAYAGQAALESFMHFLRSPCFCDFPNLPQADRDSWRPVRTLEKRRYSSDGSALRLEGFFGTRRLVRPQEVRIFEWCAGKLSWREVAKRVRDEFLPGGTLKQVEVRWMIPLFRRLDRSYQILFHQ